MVSPHSSGLEGALGRCVQLHLAFDASQGVREGVETRVVSQPFHQLCINRRIRFERVDLVSGLQQGFAHIPGMCPHIDRLPRWQIRIEESHQTRLGIGKTVIGGLYTNLTHKLFIKDGFRGSFEGLR